MFAQHYATYYDLLNQDAHSKEEVDFVYTLAGRPLSILDIGCGTANYWQYFPDGIDIVGLEKSEAMTGQVSKGVIVREDVTTYTNGTNILFPKPFDCALSLFDAMNYIEDHRWWAHLPLRPGGAFIFDIWDKAKVDREGFRQTKKIVGGITRTITPLSYDGKIVKLEILVDHADGWFTEIHTMYVLSRADIIQFCGNEFDLIKTIHTDRWKTWYKLVRK